MATPRVRRPYTITYDTCTFVTYDLTSAEYDMISDAILTNQHAVQLPFGVLRTQTITSVIKQREIEQPTALSVSDLAKTDPQHTMTEEDAMWLRQLREAGIDPDTEGAY